ncbi:MTOR-associated protein MEAK7 isoform X2 [Syngnathoides biaculeatus]|uniref:MTOR-associated protein MEAK7 isoform X2 n=1 Tax=Syngnathoides biaculeatus TaxID=300417 RepID=UPI002ADDDDB5|nr:MTOR-associated protein MEAK7 isoform X2 [Syngnathoides biaculeatus]XP_061678309.1 MTOR-associated protein MEAK7 isoform X2 [Syngnathoides biaculeatus]XP_061678310.1 MTOR-associated protein MEAK7 isoform X2 [Syngnathoides biaculeatus]XP_061678311.1 MTOR-associated protein MEAK7 isoform X2 [Syngnathoides biaculeatus]
MGNSESVVVQKRLSRFRPEDRPVIEGVFDRLHGNVVVPAGALKNVEAINTLTLEMLQSSMCMLEPDSIIRRSYQGMRSIDYGATASGKVNTSATSGVCREQLVIFLADTLHGTAEERAPLVMAMSRGGVCSKDVTYEEVKEFLQDLISAVVQIMVRKGLLQGWKPAKMGDGCQCVKLLVEQLCSELKPTGKQPELVCELKKFGLEIFWRYFGAYHHTTWTLIPVLLRCFRLSSTVEMPTIRGTEGGYDIACLEDWLFRVPQVSLYLEMLVTEGLNVWPSVRPSLPLLPSCKDTPWEDLRCLLDIPTIMFLASQLPDRYSAPWRLVFSTLVHGESFTRMVGGLTKCGPTLLLIKDSKGYIFGGFASLSWEVRPQFHGDSRCFLFSVFPRLRVHTATGYNQHFMYLNQNQQTMPNGLGMGGQHNYFGLWLNSDFRHGHSRARPICTTFGSPQLSGDEDFILDSMEVWAVGKPELEEGGEGEAKGSVLDMDLEVQVMMEMTSKNLHSQGLRESNVQKH